jgi:predicted N-acetyltransferase YhbS
MPQRPLEARRPVGAGPPRPHVLPTSSVAVRDATSADTSRIVEITNSAYKPRDGKIFSGERTSSDEVQSALDTAGATVVVAEVGGVVAACVHLELAPPHAHFGPLATALTHQGRGLAPLLIAECERRARAAACAKMHIGIIREVGLQPYYEHLGYTKSGEIPGQQLPWGANTKQPFVLILMEKTL